MDNLPSTHMNPALWSQVRFFSRKEFDSRDKDGSGVGTGDNMHPRVVFMLDALRGLVGKVLGISSGYRTKAHNKAEGGAPASAHLTGEAADVKWSHLTREEKVLVIDLARKLGFTGIGIGVTFIHLDTKPRIASWRYTAKGMVKVPVGQEINWV